MDLAYSVREVPLHLGNGGIVSESSSDTLLEINNEEG